MYKIHETLWFCLVSLQCSCGGRAHCREEIPVCHDCLVVNGTSKLIIIYLHGTAARVLTSGHPPETVITRMLTYGHSPGSLKHDIGSWG